MMRAFALAIALVAASNTFTFAQSGVQIVPGGGMVIRSGGMTTYYRADGGYQTWHRVGNTQLYNDSYGTTGSSLYTGSGRFDNYSNSNRGWTGSGYTPYSGYGSTYQRSYTPTYRSYYGR